MKSVLAVLMIFGLVAGLAAPQSDRAKDFLSKILSH